ncbi:MAG: hypothetical protein JWN00_380 [Actinomycetia bacterium]|nr:hypothetical protein [Actinomycetes bacterium]
MLRRVVSEHDLRGGKELVSRVDVGGSFGQAGVDLLEMVVDPCDQADVEELIGTDGSSEISPGSVGVLRPTACWARYADGGVLQGVLPLRRPQTVGDMLAGLTLAADH